MTGQLIVSGLAVGSVYALIALAMVIIYKTSEVLNYAQGEMAMLSAFTAYSMLDTYRIPFWASFALALIFAAALGMFLEFCFLRRAKNPNLLGLILITLGFEMILYGLAGWKWGADQKNFPFPVSDTDVIEVSGMIISYLNLWTMGVALAAMLSLWIFFKYTKVGLAMKATQQNHQAARLMGIRTKRILNLTWAISSVVGALAAMFLAPVVTLDPNLMIDPMLKGFASAVLGGMTSLLGAALGGYLLGVIENLFGGLVSLEFKSVVAFLIIVLILCFRPSGLLTRHYVKKV
ncbi:MAG: branched-chain amino acid ABC transporter permease [Deltaproteobacteria bacterium]|nr:branched-chain amino acid ABC transporter permease [Deltaproteobacteria bacterium]